MNEFQYLAIFKHFQSCQHNCVCANSAPDLHSCVCGSCPCGGTCYDCYCCPSVNIYSNAAGRTVCEAHDCGCGAEWTSSTSGVRRCKNCGECFPATARLSLENGKSVMMSELQVGDRVQTGNSITVIYKDASPIFQ